jgi:hypothetical protein
MRITEMKRSEGPAVEGRRLGRRFALGFEMSKSEQIAAP